MKVWSGTAKVPEFEFPIWPGRVFFSFYVLRLKKLLACFFFCCEPNCLIVERVFDMFRQVKISQVQIFFQIVFFFA